MSPVVVEREAYNRSFFARARILSESGRRPTMELDNQLLYTGRLLVKTELLGRRTWVLRHVELGAATLAWFSGSESELVGSVSLEGATVIVPENPKHAFAFEVDWDGQDYLPLRALSLEEWRDWVNVSWPIVVSCSMAEMLTPHPKPAADTAGRLMALVHTPCRNSSGRRSLRVPLSRGNGDVLV